MNCKYCGAEMESSTSGICWECLLKPRVEESEEALMSLFGDNNLEEEK